MVSVEAPSRMSISGHSTSRLALVTGCGSFCVAVEKKLATRSLNEGAGGGGGAAEVVAVDGGAALVAGGGADAAAGAGPLTPPDEQPAAPSARTRTVAEHTPA
jgi:hypothetical protein